MLYIEHTNEKIEHTNEYIEHTNELQDPLNFFLCQYQRWSFLSFWNPRLF